MFYYLLQNMAVLVSEHKCFLVQSKASGSMVRVVFQFHTFKNFHRRFKNSLISKESIKKYRQEREENESKDK